MSERNQPKPGLEKPELRGDIIPLYSFLCPECGDKEESVREMKNADKACMCTCGTRMNRNFAADVPFASGDYHHGAIHSNSLAINPEQRSEHEQKFPNIKLDSQCRPIFDNFQSHQKYLDQCNIIKERKKIRPKGKRIA